LATLYDGNSLKQDFNKYDELRALGNGSLERYLIPAFDISHLQNYQQWKDQRDSRDQGRFWGHLPPTDQIKNFLDDVGDIVDPQTILEIGICLGYSATYMLQSWPGCKILGVDKVAFQKYPAHDVHTNRACLEFTIAKYPGRYFPLQCDSKELGKGWMLNPNGAFDLAFVDGWHNYEYAWADIQSCKDLNIKYLMIDNALTTDGVRRAIKDHELIEEISVEYETVRSLVNGLPPQRLQMWVEKLGLYTWKN